MRRAPAPRRRSRLLPRRGSRVARASALPGCANASPVPRSGAQARASMSGPSTTRSRATTPARSRKAEIRVAAARRCDRRASRRQVLAVAHVKSVSPLGPARVSRSALSALGSWLSAGSASATASAAARRASESGTAGCGADRSRPPTRQRARRASSRAGSAASACVRVESASRTGSGIIAEGRAYRCPANRHNRPGQRIGVSKATCASASLQSDAEHTLNL